MQAAQHLKNQGQQLALLNAGPDWKAAAMQLLREYCSLDEAKPSFRFEQFRAWALCHGLWEPPSHKVWGSLPLIACREGIIRWTGNYEPAISAKTHGHAVKTWKVAA